LNWLCQASNSSSTDSVAAMSDGAKERTCGRARLGPQDMRQAIYGLFEAFPELGEDSRAAGKRERTSSFLFF
jgi:hypothetical protein